MTDTKPTIGVALDQVLAALTSLDPRARRTVLEAACTQLDIEKSLQLNAPGGTPQPPAPAPGTLTPATPMPAQGTALDIRALKDQKQPANSQQMACIVAFYLQEHAPQEERKQAIDVADLDKYFKQAGFPFPKKLYQVLVDAKSAGYLESVERGRYKLTRVGYNLVAHKLPGKARSSG